MNKNPSEANFSGRERQRTQAELLRTLDELKASCATAADVRLWTQAYPWTAVGLAAVAGFAAAAVVTPSRDEGLREHLANLACRLKSDGEAAEPSPARQAKAGWLGMMMGPLLSTLTSLAQSYLLSILHPQGKAPAEPPQGHNGDSAVAQAAGID